jgi:hypothetical protein
MTDLAGSRSPVLQSIAGHLMDRATLTHLRLFNKAVSVAEFVYCRKI